MNDPLLPVPFVDLTISPVTKVAHGHGHALQASNNARKPSFLGKRDRAAQDNTSNKNAKKTTSHNASKVYVDMSQGDEDQDDNKENLDSMEVSEHFGASVISAHLDALLDVQYAHEIHLTHLDNEKAYFERRRSQASDNAGNNGEITPQMRTILVEWLIEVAEEYYLTSQTLHLTVNYVDRFLARNKIPRASLQLLGVTCMLIASKFEEIYAPLVDDFAFITDNTYSRSDILTTEVAVLNSLDFRLAASTVMNFLDRFLHVVAVHEEQRIVHLARYLAELSLPQTWALNYLPSLIATACVVLALHTVNRVPLPDILERYTNYNAASVAPVVDQLHHSYLTVFNHTRPHSARDKYRLPKYHSVAEIPPPANSPFS